MLRFNANLFRIAAAFVSKEDTRYYLKGVFVEPHAVKGVTLTATDGHRLFCVHDEDGAADESAIIALTPEASKACKPGKKEDRREISVVGDTATVLAFSLPPSRQDPETGVPVSIAANCRVDGTFPDYRSAIPQGTQELDKDAKPAFFDGRYLGTFGDAADELQKHFVESSSYSSLTSHARAVMRVIGKDAKSPHVVIFGNVPQAFGVIMPVSCRNEALQVPAWIFLKADPKPETKPEPVLEAAE